jgi:hypothetical protein
LEGLSCSHCSQKFTEKEIEDRNFDIWFDTSNDVKLIEMKKIEEKFPDVKWEGEGRMKMRDFNKDYWDLLYCPFGREGYQFSIWIRSIEHENCPTVMKCENCYGKFLEKELTADNEWGMSYYCPPCWKERNKETNHE